MLSKWWELWPERLEYELEALAKAGIHYERDEKAFSAGRLVLKLSTTIDGEKIDLLAVFPDLYPYFRFSVYAPLLALEHHQSPFNKNLCLIGRAAENWRLGDTLAGFITDRLPMVIKTGRSISRDEVSEEEEHQAEPVSTYYPIYKNSIVIIGGHWAIDPAVQKGEMLIGVREDSGLLLRGAVLQIKAQDGRILAEADPALRDLYPKSLRTRWVRTNSPILKEDAREFMKELITNNPEFAQDWWKQVNGGSLDVIGTLFEEEHDWRGSSDGWLFVVRQWEKKLKGGYKKEIGSYFARPGRAGKSDLTTRVPELALLSNASISIVGLGGIGAPSALEFGRAGVGELRLLDDDYIDPGTAVRYPFGLESAGRLKVDVIQEYLNKNHPYTKVQAYQHRIGGVRESEQESTDLVVIEKLFENINLVYDASADLGIQYFLSDMCSQRNVPYVCVSTTSGAWGGVIARFVPGKTEGCWSCLQAALLDGTIPLPPADPNGNVQPAGCADPTFTGAGFDVTEIALAGVRAGVSTLLEGNEGAYPVIKWDVAIISFRDNAGKAIVPNSQTFHLHRHSLCKNEKAHRPILGFEAAG